MNPGVYPSSPWGEVSETVRLAKRRKILREKKAPFSACLPTRHSSKPTCSAAARGRPRQPRPGHGVRAQFPHSALEPCPYLAVAFQPQTWTLLFCSFVVLPLQPPPSTRPPNKTRYILSCVKPAVNTHSIHLVTLYFRLLLFCTCFPSILHPQDEQFNRSHRPPGLKGSAWKRCTRVRVEKEEGKSENEKSTQEPR